MDENRTGKIRILKDGPYLVTGRIPLVEDEMIIGPDGEPARWEEKAAYPEQETYALCRCGESKRMPFCDGTHTKIGFDGTETGCRDPYLTQVEWTKGPRLDVTWSRKLCMEARFCHRAGDAWTLTEKSDDPAARETAVEEASCCPSGSLTAWDKETGQADRTGARAVDRLDRESRRLGGSGPIWVRGGIPIEAADGTTYEIRNRVTLCRCGKSGIKPFCDGTHVTAGFKAKG